MSKLRAVFWLAALSALAVGAWFAFRSRTSNADAANASTGPGAPRRTEWERLTPEGSARARTAIESLAKAGAPASVTVRPGDLAAYVLAELAKDLPPSARDIQATIIGELFYVRATVKPADIADAGALGSFGALLAEHEEIAFGGSLEIVRPGLAQLRVTEIHLGEFKLPKVLVPRLLRSMAQRARPAGVADGAVGLAVPAYVGQVRLTANGVIVSGLPR